MSQGTISGEIADGGVKHYRVRRDELFDSSSGDESNHGENQDVARAELNARLSSLFSFDLNPALPTRESEVESHEAQDPGAPEFEFRLFASQGTLTQKVILPSQQDLANVDEGAFTKPRPLSYYLRPELDLEEQEEIRFSAMAGREILTAARQRAWGLEKPWRVLKIIMPAGTKLLRPVPLLSECAIGDTASGEEPKRRRPGKKRRIATRKREKARKEEEAKEQARILSKRSTSRKRRSG